MTLYQTDFNGPVRIIQRDVTGKVLVEATQIVRNRPEYPFTINPGFREWISPHSLGGALTGKARGGSDV